MIGQYDPAYIFPASLEEAEKHRLANRIFKGDAQISYDFHKCQCCARSIGDPQVKVQCCYDPVKKLIFLGPGVPLLFIFNRISVLLLLLLSLVFGIYAIITNFQGDSCNLTPNCELTIFVQLSIANKIFDASKINIQNYLLMGFIFVYIIFLHFLIYQVRKTNQRSDELINSPSDYSLMISQLPEQWSVSDILAMIDEQRAILDVEQRKITNNLAIKDMIFAFKMSQFLELKEQDEEQFVKTKKDDPTAPYQRVQVDMPNQLARFVIVIFQQQASKQIFKQPKSCFSWIRSFLCHCTLCLNYSRFQVKDQPVVVERAPEPDDILWSNADKPRNAIIRNKIISYVCSLGLLVLSGYIQYQLEVQKNSITDQTLINIYNVLSSLSLSIFNAILSFFLVFMTNKQGDLTQTHMNSSLLVKISLFEFFNAGIFNTFARILAQNVDTFNIHGNSSYQITLFITINAFVQNIVSLILTFTQFPASLKRVLIRKGCLSYNQKKTNQIYQAPHIQFPLKYAYIIYSIWLACFYGAFVPITIPISMLGLVFFELSQTFLFRNHYSAPYMLSKAIIDTAISLLRYTGLVSLSGCFIITIFISYKLQADFTIIEGIPFIIGFIISLIIIFMPSSRINQKIFHIESKQEIPPVYDIACRQFTVTYKETHPLTTHALKMSRGQVLTKNFHQLVEMKATHYKSQGKIGDSLKWQELNSSRSTNNPLLKKTESLVI